MRRIKSGEEDLAVRCYCTVRYTCAPSRSWTFHPAVAIIALSYPGRHFLSGAIATTAERRLKILCSLCSTTRRDFSSTRHVCCRARAPRAPDSQVLGGKLSRYTRADKHAALRPLRKGDMPHTQVSGQVRRPERQAIDGVALSLPSIKVLRIR